MLARVERLALRLLGGETSARPYALIRIGLATLVLLRTHVVDLLPMDHHSWVPGWLEYHPSHDRPAAPALHSPLGFFPALSPTLTAALTWARTGLAALLLLGLRPRVVAGLLALVGYSLMAADRYRYLHHLHLLWTSVALLALCPADGRLALRSPRRELVVRWPLQLLRLHALAAWGYAGLAKLNGPWLRGETLRDLHGAGLVDGPVVDAAAAALGWSGLAWGVALVELGLPLVLAMPRTRLIGVALAVPFHLGIETSVMVSTFGATMLVLTVSFLPFGSSAWDSPGTEGDFTPRLENGPRADDGPMEDPTRSSD